MYKRKKKSPQKRTHTLKKMKRKKVPSKEKTYPIKKRALKRENTPIKKTKKQLEKRNTPIQSTKEKTRKKGTEKYPRAAAFAPLFSPAPSRRRTLKIGGAERIASTAGFEDDGSPENGAEMGGSF